MGQTIFLLLLCLLPVLLPGPALAGFGSYSSVMHPVDGFRVYSTALGAQGIRSVAVQSDAKILVGGDFTITRNGTPHSYLCRINPDGTVDARFASSLSGAVSALLLQPKPYDPDGVQRVYAGGMFGLVRLAGGDGSPDGSFDQTSTQDFNVSVLALAPGGAGVLVAGTHPVTVDSVTTQEPILALVAEGGTLVWSYSGSSVGAVALQGNLILAGGAALVRINPDGTVKDSFALPPGLGAVRSLALQPDGKILVAADSLAVPGASCLARLKPDGSIDAGFGQGVTGLTSQLLLQPDGRILVAGDFVIGVVPGYLARFNPDGSADATFAPLLDAAPSTLALQFDGNILAGGSFSTVNGQPRVGLARFYPQGALDDDMPAITLWANGSSYTGYGTIYVTTLQPDGKTVIGGGITDIQYGSGPLLPTTFIARFTQDWSLTNDFSTSPLDRMVLDLTLLPDLSLIAGGIFTVPQPLVLRFDPSGISNPVPSPNETTTFNDNLHFNGQLVTDLDSYGIQAVTVQKDGMIYIGGQLLTDFNSPYCFLARFRADGTRDDSFLPDATVDGEVFSITIQSDGYILVGTNTGKLLRLYPGGGLQHDLTPPPSSNGIYSEYISSIVLDAQNRILIAGQWDNGADFSTIRSKAMRLKNAPGASDDGAVDASFFLKDRPISTSMPCSTAWCCRLTEAYWSTGASCS